MKCVRFCLFCFFLLLFEEKKNTEEGNVGAKPDVRNLRKAW